MKKKVSSLSKKKVGPDSGFQNSGVKKKRAVKPSVKRAMK